MASERDSSTLTTLVVTHTRKGFTDNMAAAIAAGVKEVPGVEVKINRVDDVDLSDLVEADALAIGSPTYLENISGKLKSLLDNSYYKFRFVEKNKLRGKPAVAFVCGKNKGYYIRKLQHKSISLKELERILFSKLKMKKAAPGIHLIHNIDILDPQAPLPLTPRQTSLCKILGNKLASSVIGLEK